MMVFLGNARSLAMSSAKMRVPLIKFRYGYNRLSGSQTHGVAASPKPQVMQSAHPTAASTTAVDESQLPRRFHRQPLSEEEIEYINRGGPA